MWNNFMLDNFNSNLYTQVSDKANIMVVDDNPSNLRVLEEMLSNRNYSVRLAINGHLALTSIHALKPDLVLLDIRLPDIDGIEICRTLKADPSTQDVPVIFISALHEQEEKLRAFAAGGVDYVTKPFEEKEVLARIHTHLSLRRLQKNLEQNSRQFRCLLDHIPAAVALLQPGQKLHYYNRCCEKNFNAKDDKYCYQILRGWQQPCKECPAARTLLPPYTPYEEIITHPNGNIYQTYYYPYSEDDSVPTAVMFMALDISAHQRLKEAEIASHAKSAFLANMSHELRTPLNSILGYAQLLEYDNDLTPSQREGIEVIHRSSDYLLTLINDILDLAKIEAGRFDIIPTLCNLPDFFKNINELFKIRCRQKDIAFHYHARSALPENVMADEKRLRQIVLNLLSNAVKFTDKGAVELSSAYCAGVLEIKVSDSGVGIDAHDLPLIFRPFQQAGATQYRNQGTGLGLSISQRLAELMHGSLEVHSHLGQGSVFSLKLPLTQLSETHCRKHQQKRVVGFRRIDGKQTPLRVLVVDNRQEDGAVLGEFLRKLGFKVDIETDPVRAVQIPPHIRPHLVLIDIIMPEREGLSTVTQMRALPHLRHTVFIAISANAYPEQRQHALNLGCVDHLSKPLDFVALLASIKTHLPLQWLEQSSPTDISSQAKDTAFSLAQAQELIHLAKAGDIGALSACLEHYRQHSAAPLLEEIQEYADNFELQRLCAVLEEYITHQPKV
jgi:signal transduction histidine kinase/CheY-like chemotaxis protein